MAESWFDLPTVKKLDPSNIQVDLKNKSWFDEAGPGGQEIIKKTSGVPRFPDSLIDILRPIVSGAGASLAAGATAPSGPGALVAGGGTYAILDALMQKLRSEPDQSVTSSALGLKEGSLPATLANTAQQAVLNKAGEKVLGAGARIVKGFNSSNVPEIYKFGPTTSQAAASQGLDKTAKTAKFLEDTFAPGAKEAAQVKSAQLLDKEAKDIGYKIGHNFVRGELDDPAVMFNAMSKEIPPENIYTPIKITKEPITRTTTNLSKQEFLESPGTTGVQRTTSKGLAPSGTKTVKIGETGKVEAAGAPEVATYADKYQHLDDVTKDSTQLQKMLTKAQESGGGTNLRSDVGAYKFMRIWQDAIKRNPTDPSKLTLDPQKLTQNLYDPEFQSSAKLLWNSKQRGDIEQFFKNVAYTQDKLGTWGSKIGLTSRGITLGGAVISALHGNFENAAIIGGVQLAANGVGKLLTNPRVSRLLVNMAGGEPLGVSQEYAARAIVNALNGMTVAIGNRQGIIRDGRFEASENVP